MSYLSIGSAQSNGGSGSSTVGALASRITGRPVSRRSAGRKRFASRSRGATFAIGMGIRHGQRRSLLPPAAGGAFDARPSVNDLPDVQSELFEQVTDDELAKHH